MEIKLNLKAPVPEVMPFGKYVGKTFEQIPSDYLHWIIGEDIDRMLKKEIILEYNSRTKNDEHWYENEEKVDLDDIDEVRFD